MTVRKLIVAVIDFPLELIFKHGVRLICRHKWRKDELTTIASMDHPLVAKGMFVKGFCPKCGKQKWLMR